MARAGLSARRVGVALVAAVSAGTLAACGSGGGGGSQAAGGRTGSTPAVTHTVQQTRVEVLKRAAGSGGFNPSAVYKREAPGVVTVISVFGGGGGSLLGGGGGGGGGGGNAALGSGFVVRGDGEVVTNAHVVTSGKGSALHKAQQVYVRFSDGNQVPAKIVGYDANSDVALLKVDPKGLTLRPLPLGSSSNLTVGSPVAAIGSPFGEPQSLSVGVVSAINRTIDSLNGQFQISGAVQTDAAINHGNSGGPLVDAQGDVIGINSQIQTSSGGGEGVGFAVPVDTVKRSIDALRSTGTVPYAYIGVGTVTVYPQLAARYHLPSKTGALVQDVTPGSPAAKAGLKAGDHKVTFEASQVTIGGDLITAVDGKQITQNFDLADAIAGDHPGQTVALTVWRGSQKRTVKLKLGARPISSGSSQSP